MEAQWDAIKQQITMSMTNMGFRVYVSIMDILGNFKCIDSQLKPYETVIKSTVQMSTNYIKVGDYCIPLSSKNLMIFKISEKSIVVLFAEKGNIAQLLSFKKNIKTFSNMIDGLIGEVLIVKAAEARPIPKEKIEKQIFGKELPSYYPIFKQKLDDKFKAIFQEIQILQLCNGQNSFTDIVKQTSQAEEMAYEFLEKQIKKKLIIPEAYPLGIDCPDCKLQHHLFLLKQVFEESEPPFKLLIRSEKCNHEYVAFIDKKLKMETQSFKYFTEFQRDKFMKRLGAHYYTIIS